MKAFAQEFNDVLGSVIVEAQVCPDNYLIV
jgi:hypothetical protein